MKVFFPAVLFFLFAALPTSALAHHCGPGQPLAEYPRHSCRTHTQTWQPGETIDPHPGGSEGRRTGLMQGTGPGPSVHCQLEADGECHCGPRSGTGRNIPCRSDQQPYPPAGQGAPPGAAPDAGPAFIDISTDILLLNQYWTRQFSQYGLIFTPADAVITAGALQYDPNIQTIQYDPDIINRINAGAGRFATSTVFAHEMAHHVQFMRGRYLWLGLRGAKGRELDADRLAGAYLRWAHDRGLVSFDDLRIALVAVFNAADTLPEFDPQRHGSTQERVGAVLDGYLKGPTPYWWRPPFGHTPPD